jgi:hypothetical protein
MPSTSVSQYFQGQHQAGSEGVLLAADIVCPGPCMLQCVAGYNAAAGLLYVQLFDKTTAPVAGDVPEMVIPVPGGRTPFSLSIPYVFTLGCSIGISSTELTYTSGGASLLYIATVQS